MSDARSQAATTHECPATGCTVGVAADRLACPRHWFRLPKVLRDQIWAAYRDRRERTHWHLVREAIALLQARQPESETMRLPGTGA